MNSNKRLYNIAGWIVFAIAMTVYFFSVERTGSLWDCGEFITGAHKLQVVHPPGAPLFILIGRLFTFVAEIFSDNPEDIAFSVNLMSGACTAMAATFICWVTIMMGKLTLVGREEEADSAQAISLAGAGIVAGLSTAFATSIWFSAVEGEVYAMSTFFTTLTFWAVIKWYSRPDVPESDRWLIFAVYCAGLSIGVHLLSLLTFPALGLFYYFKKYDNHNIKGMALGVIGGLAFLVFIQKAIIVGIPKVWSLFELFTVNTMGLPFHSGIVPTVLLLVGLVYFGLKWAHDKRNALAQNLIVAATLVVIGFSTIGVVVIRANANTPINMNNPSDVFRLIPYINREQYGERPLLKGPHFNGSLKATNVTDRYGKVGDHYEYTEQKISQEWDPAGEMMFPRMGHMDPNRKPLYYQWMGRTSGNPTMGDNIHYFLRYQVGWMYWRYFMWNFSGRQNGEQGFNPHDLKSGHWISGIPFVDNTRLYDQGSMPESMLNDQARNRYFMIPLFLGLLGVFFHLKRRPNDFIGLLALFIITGIGIIIYSNQPPNEPRERDYVLAGSIFTFCIWIGMGVLALANILRTKVNLDMKMAGPIAIAVALSAPLLMGTQNFDDNSRRHHKGSRDYASNFLHSCDPNAIIFTYGDNDTYPLWYAQEIEGIRTDVRVVNLSLIAVDWYIDQLRRKVNNSPAIKMSIPKEAMYGKKRIQIPFIEKAETMSLKDALKWVGEDHPVPLQNGKSLESFLPTRNVYIPVNKRRVIENGTVSIKDTARIEDRISFNLGKGNFLFKGDLAILDILASNAFERPVYFAVTCRPESLHGLDNYFELEGLSLRFIPVKSKGDRKYGMVGKGRVDLDSAYKNIMEKFSWGNFDKERLFVDRSYGPSIQTIRVSMMRLGEELLKAGDTKRAVDIVDKYFEAFPHMNFSFDGNTMIFINMYEQANQHEKALPQIRTLAKETEEQLQFLMYGLTPDELQAGFTQEFSNFQRVKNDLLRVARESGDKALEEELKAQFSPFDLGSTENR
ncbi:MAG: hypothetical protein ACI8YQ_000933 [Polaribacter sp.]|jgi:hypothetical protein